MHIGMPRKQRRYAVQKCCVALLTFEPCRRNDERAVCGNAQFQADIIFISCRLLHHCNVNAERDYRSSMCWKPFDVYHLFLRNLRRRHSMIDTVMNEAMTEQTDLGPKSRVVKIRRADKMLCKHELSLRRGGKERTRQERTPKVRMYYVGTPSGNCPMCSRPIYWEISAPKPKRVHGHARATTTLKQF
ncbi:MAG: hypothetical protein JWO42_3874 [Chloroflexi bacterium]|nr:hypothetical protein [Chloroflexota bacterium]